MNNGMYFESANVSSLSYSSRSINEHDKHEV